MNRGHVVVSAVWVTVAVTAFASDGPVGVAVAVGGPAVVAVGGVLWLRHRRLVP